MGSGNENGESVFNVALSGVGSEGLVFGTGHGHGGETFVSPGLNTDPDTMSEDTNECSYHVESDDSMD